MAKVQEIGPYSAYAIAVKYGYKGTEEEWVKEQEANRKAAEAAAAAAAQSAKDAAASASGVAQSGQQAVQSIKDAQTAAEQAIDTAKQQAVQAAQAEAEKAATSAGQAASSAAEAAQSATSAAAEVGKVQSAGTAAVQAVQQAQSTATEAVSDAQQSATQAVSQAQTAAVSAVQEAGTTQTSAVASAASSALTNISGAKDAALSDVAEAGTAQVSAIGTTGADAVEDVNEAKTAALEAIDAANAALPSPTQSDTGKVPTVKADGSAYELAGPYAPLSAAIRPTASGNPVSITDSVEWPLLGLKVYGKSTQVTTTGAQLIDIQAWQTADSEYYKIAEDGGMIQLKADYRSLAKVPTFLELEAGYYTTSVNTGFMLQIIKDGVELVNTIGGISNTFTLDSPATIGMKAFMNSATNKYPSPVAYPMINAGSTVKPWEPYTGGKPSPSPEYSHPIVSAGASGNIETTITGKNLLTGRLYYGLYDNGFAVIQNENVVSLPYAPEMETLGVCYTVPAKKGKTYTLSVTNPNANARLFFALYKTFEDTSNYEKAISKIEGMPSVSITPSEDGILVCLIAGIWTDGTTAIHECTASELLQLEVGSTATAYEAPHSQSIVAVTPNGLPGIPVDSGGNYTDAEGQQSACDVKDYGTGKYTQMVGHIESYNGENITTPYMSTTGQLSTGAEVYYVLDEPVVTDISADELTAYRALHTYDGTTVVSTPEDVTDIEVRYVANGEKYIDRKISEAIASAAETKLAAYDTLSGAIHEGVNEA